MPNESEAACCQDGRSLVPILESALRARGDADRWTLRHSEPWCSVTPAGHRVRAQGWKLHVAATAASASAVLERSLPVLLDAGCAFKFAGSVEEVVRLNAPNYPREGAGKFITVYPADDADAPTLAELLHLATEGHPAPAVLSDRRYRPDSAVHYRFGAFDGTRVITNDGGYRMVLLGPDGRPAEDVREPRFTPPQWAASPFETAPSAPQQRRAILLGERFRVTEAVRHANKGGVYRAVDETDGSDAIVKEARPHVAGDARGHDARDVLRHEATMLERLAPLGIVPRPLALFEQGGHLFLAQERVPGVTLRRWTLERDGALPPEGALALAEALAAALAAVHGAGVVVRDFTPQNVMVLPTAEVRLIDLELAISDGHDDPETDLARGRATLGYGAPEQFAGEPAAKTADAYSLGALLAYLLSGQDPYVEPDEPGGRTPAEQLAEWLCTGPRALAISADMRRLILALTDEDPAGRPSADQARREIAAIRARGPETVRHDAAEIAASTLRDLVRLEAGAWEQAVEGALAEVTETLSLERDDRLWPTTSFGSTTDACNVQHGAAGVLAVLCRAHALTGDPRLPAAIAGVAEWIERRADVRRPPGLYFGAAGIGWALGDAGHALGDERLMRRGLAVALAQPHEWPSPDVTHGVSGLGLALLHLHRLTGAPEALAHAVRCADGLAARVEDGRHGIGWRVPGDFDSTFAGKRFHGFAHGTAGIAQFLLDAGRMSGRADLVELAADAGVALLRAAVEVDGGLAWPSEPEGPQVPLRYWCSGSAGVGAFLARLHVTTGDPRFRAAAEGAGRAVMHEKWRLGLAYCHGLSGNADFLLDLAELLGDERYRAWAEDLASIMWFGRVRRRGRELFSAEPGVVVPDFNVGYGGALAFLLRLRFGGPRMWLVDGAGR